MQIRKNSPTELVVLAIVVTLANLYLLNSDEVLYSYKNFNALFLQRDDWYVYYFIIATLPLISFVNGISMLISLFTNTWSSNRVELSPAIVDILRLLYIYCALGCLFFSLLSLKYYLPLF